MKSFCLFFLVLFSPLFAEMETIKGQVLSIQKYQKLDQPAPWVQIFVNAESGLYVVEVGPAWYLKMQGVEFAPKNQVEIQGEKIVVDGHFRLIAYQIKKGSFLVKLRSADGKPLWLAWEESPS